MVSSVAVLILLLCGLQLTYDAGYDAVDSQKRRGRALIIANSKFSSLQERHGTEVDIQRLESVFRWLNFKVVVHKDLTSQVSFTRLSIIY